MAIAPDQIRDGIETLDDRYVPRFEVFFAKERSDVEPAPAPVQPPLEPKVAIAQEKARLDAKVFRASGDPNDPPPKLGQLIPLAGPWGEKPGQFTNDVLSIEFTESVEKKQPLTTVKIELHNVYDSERQYFRYTDIPADLPQERLGVFPLVEYGNTLALRFGYGDELDWVFEGMITKLDVKFPADGEPKVTVTAVDKRDRLRSKKKIKTKSFKGASEEEIAAQVARLVGLTVAAPADQKTAIPKSKKGQPSDQDALQYLTDRANKASLELACFGNVLFVLAPGDDAKDAIRYAYRRGLTSFAPTFNGVGKPTSVQVKSRNPTTGEEFDVTVSTKDLQDMGLAPPSKKKEGTALDKVKKDGQSGERVEVVTNYLAQSEEEARRIAIAILKRNLDETITVSGDLVGDPRVRPRLTLDVQGVGRFNGFYYITAATHRFGSNGYQTNFKARRNAALAESGAARRDEAEA